MNTKTKLLISGFIALSLVLNIVALNKQGVQQNVERTVGAVSGPDFFGPYWGVNGVQQYSYSGEFNNASTTLCSFRAPAATTTIELLSVNVTTATSTAIFIEMGKSAGSAATTTLLASKYNFAASEKGTIVASSTSATTAGYFVLGPSNYLNVKFAHAGAFTDTTNSLRGTCKAVLTAN